MVNGLRDCHLDRDSIMNLEKLTEEDRDSMTEILEKVTEERDYMKKGTHESNRGTRLYEKGT